MQSAQRFSIKTYGCQMNAHDSQKVANLLLHAGMEATDDPEDADLLLINTCSIRDKAESRLYGDLGRMREWKGRRPGRVLGVGGCVAQQQGDALLRRFPQLDFVYGTHNLRLVPTLVAAAGSGQRASHTEETRSQERFDFPDRHPAYSGDFPGRAFVTVMEGCDMFCSFCIVPFTRGREISRPADAIVEEVRQGVAAGVREVTLLGQTVNAYGRHDLRRGHSHRGTVQFAELLRRLDAIPGLERIRYISPHPLFFDADLIRAHGELQSLCPHVHLPLQSGSATILERMRRRYTPDEYRKIVVGLRESRPDVAITTDVIVGTPGESESDFRETLALVRELGFVDSFCFKYSPRPGTAAAEALDPVPAEVTSRRLEELLSLQRGLTLAYHRGRVGGSIRILLEGPSRRGGGQLRGRDPYLRVVNVDPAPGSETAVGTLVEVEIVDATPHSLVGELRSKRSPSQGLAGDLRVLAS